MAKPAYEREAKRLTPNDVQSAISYSQSAKIVGRIAEWRDLKTVGLTLRITPRQAVWYLRRRDITLRMGPASEIDLETARYIADQTRLAAKKNRNLRVFVDTLVGLETDKSRYRDSWSWKEADEFADNSSAWAQRKRIGDTGFTWTWKALTHHFLEYQKPKLKERYRKQYAHYLELDAFKTIAEKLVCEIKPSDLDRVRDQILIDHAPSAAHRAVQQGKVMLSWAYKYRTAKAGLDEVKGAWWTERWAFEYHTKKRRRAPTMEQIARTLLIAENHRDLAKGEHETYPGTIGALWGVALTAQRTGSFLLMRLDRLFGAKKIKKDLRGWKVANWEAEEMKGGRDGGRPHSLPIPPNALNILNRFHKEAGGNSPWMFPGKDSSKPITPSALNLLIYRMQGRVFDHTVKRKPDRPGKPGPKPAPERKIRKNLFEEHKIEHWSPHDIRRSMTTFLSDHQLGGAASAILGHKIPGEEVSERESAALVTEKHYNLSQKIDLKAEGMELWVDALLATYCREKKKIERSGIKKSPLSARQRQKSVPTEAAITSAR